MGQEIIYFDNAATSYPKPEQVYRAVDNCLRHSGSAGRGGHRLAMDAARIVFDSRTTVADFLGCPSERLIFTPGCTYSINMVLKGLSWKSGDLVLVSALEHNAVMRPLRQLESSHGIKVAVLPYSSGQIVSHPALVDAIQTLSPRLFVVAEGSNVTGELVNLHMVADACRHHGVPLLVDAAQTAGRQQNILQMDGISYWAAPAHKGLYGPPGLGLLFVNPAFDLQPLVSGGTGSASEQTVPPTVYPDRLEPGTVAVHAMAGLAAAVRFIGDTGVARVVEHEKQMNERFLRWAMANTFVKTFGEVTKPNRLPVFSFHLNGLTPDRIADLLDAEYGIAVRAGLHCAAQAHATLGTTLQGTCRVSFGFFNSTDEVDVLCSALTSLNKLAARV